VGQLYSCQSPCHQFCISLCYVSGELGGGTGEGDEFVDAEGDGWGDDDDLELEVIICTDFYKYTFYNVY